MEDVLFPDVVHVCLLQLLENKPLIPTTISDQIRLW